MAVLHSNGGFPPNSSLIALTGPSRLRVSVAISTSEGIGSVPPLNYSTKI